MVKIIERWRKILRMVFRGISVSVVSLIIQACYGMIPPDEWAEYGMPPPEYLQETSIRGKVTAKHTGEPIFGIKVSIHGTEYWDRTDKYGNFYFWVPIQDEYKLKFEDVDGPYNGGLFKEQIWTIKLADTDTTLLIGMDIDTE
jgi:putative lipoprotein (rSAM/lipoprotein system)